MTTVEEYAAGFNEDPGYLDFARVGPVGSAVEAEAGAQLALLGRARFDALTGVLDQDERMRTAVAAVSGFPADRVVFQPSTTHGLLHAMFGVTGGVALSPAEFPSLPFAAMRAAESLGVLAPLWIETDHGRVTPGTLRDRLTSAVAAVAVSLVDYRTGYVADLEGIRQVIGDRLLIVDAIQGFGVVDAPFGVADVVACGGQKFVRAGAGTGFLALSERALEQLTPVWSGPAGIDGDPMTVGADVPEPSSTARAFQVSNPDPLAQARLAVALEEIAGVGVAAIQGRIAEIVDQVIVLADEVGIPVTSPREPAERAAIVVLEPAPEHLTALTAALHNQGVTATVRHGSVRLSVHASTTDETLEMLRSTFTTFAAGTNP